MNKKEFRVLIKPRIITAKSGKKDIKSIAIMILWRNLD